MTYQAFRKGIGISQLATGFLLSLYGLTQLLLDLTAFTNSILPPTALGILLILLWAGPMAYELMPPEPLRRFGLNRMRTDRICVKHQKEVVIKEDLRAHVKVKQTWIFLEQPEPEDLSESYSIDPKLPVEHFSYRSPDAVEVSRQKVANGRITVFWRPKEPILPFNEYEHEDEWEPPVRYDQPACYTEFHCIFKTGQFETKITAPFPIEEVITFRRPYLRRLMSDLAFMRFALSKRRRSWGTWQTMNHGHHLVWKIVNPAVNRSYVCVYFKPGGREFWETKIRRQSFLEKLRFLR